MVQFESNIENYFEFMIVCEMKIIIHSFNITTEENFELDSWFHLALSLLIHAWDDVNSSVSNGTLDLVAEVML